ncbi:MAG: AAA family ATPase [Verrucomicrobia bacterium]|nr:AAA family ATPase [Verrucomicrobiota bacterium]
MAEARYDMSQEADKETLLDLSQSVSRIKAEVAKVIVGQDETVELLLVALFSGGHTLLSGVPGLARTSLISALCKATNLTFGRIQFTPDMLPSDVTGSEIIEQDKATGARDFRFMRGPIFANMILADEINRTPPKTQAALIEAMEEHQVTAGSQCFKLEEPFIVMATLNIIDQEGVYGLPEGSPQLDRFMFKVLMGYPSRDQESEIVDRTTSLYQAEVSSVLARDQILKFQHAIRRIPVAQHVKEFALSLVEKSRPDSPRASDFIKRVVHWGAGPRAGQHLVLGAKAAAAMKGRPTPSEQDIIRLAVPVLRHRIIATFHATAEGITPENIVAELVKETRTEQRARIPLRGRARKLVGV